MHFFDCEDPVCLPTWAYVPRAALPGTVCIHVNTQKFGLWGKICEYKGEQRAGAMFQGIEPTMYAFWMGSSSSLLCFAVLNNPPRSHIQGFGLPPSFMHGHVPPSQRAVCLGGSLGTCVPGWTPPPVADSLCA